MNALFLLFSTFGFIAIFWLDEVGRDVSFVVPILLMIIYSIVIRQKITNSQEEHLSEHQIDSVYFLGFIFTLISLFSIFSRLSGYMNDGAESSDISIIFHFIGIAVMTSILGVVFRNMLRGSFLSHFVQREDNLEASYRLLQEIANEFSSNFNSLFDQLKDVVELRMHVSAETLKEETEYREALSGLTRASREVTSTMTHSGDIIERAASDLQSLSKTQATEVVRLSEAVDSISRETKQLCGQLESMPIDPVAQSLRSLSVDVKELEVVVDGIISVLDKRLKKIQ